MKLIANIGNRNLILKNSISKTSILNDLELGDEGLFEFDSLFINKKNFRKITEFLNNNYVFYKDYIELNIIDKVLDYGFDAYYFFVTNQDNNNEQDSKYAGEIMKKMLSNKNVILKEFSLNPTNKKSVFYFYKNFLSELNNFEDEEIYILSSGGVPAMKETLNFASTINIKNLKLVDISEKTGEIVEGGIEEIYIKEFEKNNLLTLIKNYDYYGVHNLMNNSKIINNKSLENMVLYILNRYNFCFEQLDINYKEIEKDLKLEEKKLFDYDFFDLSIEDNDNKELGDLQSLLDNDYFEIEIKRFLELFDNIEITYRKGEYTMLLGKIFRLQEGITRFFIEYYTNLSTNQVKLENNEDRNDPLKLYPIFNYLFDKYVDLGSYLKEEKIDISKGLNTFLMSKIISYLHENKKIDKKFKILYGIYYDLSKNTDVFKNIRNVSIMAHGWKGISQNTIDDKKLMEKINDISKNFKNYFNIIDDENYFDKYNKILEKRIKEL